MDKNTEVKQGNLFANVLKPKAKRISVANNEAGDGDAAANAFGASATPATEFKLGRKTMTDAAGAKINLFAKKRLKNNINN